MEIYQKNAQKIDINYGYIGEESLKNLDKTVHNVVNLLISKGMTISVAESCTGGLVTQLITSVSGASQVFEMGLCAYANRIKHQLLDVPDEELNIFGAVSSQVAISMAKGIKKKAGSDISVSVTGIAGPDGGTEKMPVGTVYIGFCYGESAESDLLHLWELEDRSRENIRLHTALAVFMKIENYLQDKTN